MTTALTINSSPVVKVKGWNWGPLVLTFIWAGYYGFWGLAILSIIPGIGFLISILLAVKGTEWAWEKDQHKNYPIFIEQQSRWNRLGIVFIAMFVVMFFLMFSFLGYSVYSLYKVNYGKTHTQIVHTMNNTGQLVELLGSPIKTDSFINFNIKNNFASYSFNAVGSKNRGRIILMKHKDETIYLAIKLLNSKETITLINNYSIVNEGLKELESGKKR